MDDRFASSRFHTESVYQTNRDRSTTCVSAAVSGVFVFKMFPRPYSSFHLLPHSILRLFRF